MDVKLHTFHSSTFTEVSGQLQAPSNIPQYPSDTSWVDVRADLDVVAKRKIPAWKQNRSHPTH